MWIIKYNTMDDNRQKGGFNESRQLSAVLLVCIFNKFGRILTHDYFYQIFSPYGNIVKILIFDKAKVWKTFIEFTSIQESRNALRNLNNMVVFQDGSKMNIFYAKRKNIQLQNSNIGGVDYFKLNKPMVSYLQNPIHSYEHTRNRSNTAVSPYFLPTFTNEQPKTEKFNKSNNSSESSYPINKHSCVNQELQYKTNQSLQDRQSGSNLQSESQSKEYHSLFCDVDQQFRQLALESMQYRQWEQIQMIEKDTTDKQTRPKERNDGVSVGDIDNYKLDESDFSFLEENDHIRKKSLTYLPSSHTHQFIQENIPSRVIFIRSIPIIYSTLAIYNLFVNFGKINRLIYLKTKTSALIEYQQLNDAIMAKDELNYTKCTLKVFYSHYQSLQYRNNFISKEQYEQIQNLQKFNQNQPPKTMFLNPPTETLYLTFITPKNQNELIEECHKLNCNIIRIEWKEGKNKQSYRGYKVKEKWSCLIQFRDINDSLLVMGFLQNYRFKYYGQKQLKISFTRSKINERKQIKKITKQIVQEYLQQEVFEPTRARWKTISYKQKFKKQQNQ